MLVSMYYGGQNIILHNNEFKGFMDVVNSSSAMKSSLCKMHSCEVIKYTTVKRQTIKIDNYHLTILGCVQLGALETLMVPRGDQIRIKTSQTLLQPLLV